MQMLHSIQSWTSFSPAYLLFYYTGEKEKKKSHTMPLIEGTKGNGPKINRQKKHENKFNNLWKYLHFSTRLWNLYVVFVAVASILLIYFGQSND